MERLDTGKKVMDRDIDIQDRQGQRYSTTTRILRLCNQVSLRETEQARASERVTESERDQGDPTVQYIL